MNQRERSVWDLVESVSILIMRGYLAAQLGHYTEGSELEPRITIKRRHIGNDPRLLYPVIKVKPKKRFAA